MVNKNILIFTRSMRILCLFFSAVCLLSSCASMPDTSWIPAYTTPKAEQCVPFARRISGIQIYGDAHTWWHKAAFSHQRGFVPKPGSVLVLSQSSKLRHGHLAVVTEVIDKRHIKVTHSNWGSNRKSRRIVYKAMPVKDISKAGDWSRVRFWNYPSNSYGFPYTASGFIYP